MEVLSKLFPADRIRLPGPGPPAIATATAKTYLLDTAFYDANQQGAAVLALRPGVNTILRVRERAQPLTAQEHALIRKAIMADVPEIHRLITYHAERNRMLFRSHGDLYEHLRDFLVCTEACDGREQVTGCAAVELVWRDLAEIKSLAVDEGLRGRGIGTQLLKAAIDEGRQLGLVRLFALTRDQAFFEKQGFQVVPRETLPHKVWTDCIRCPLNEQCDEIALVCELREQS